MRILFLLLALISTLGVNAGAADRRRMMYPTKLFDWQARNSDLVKICPYTTLITGTCTRGVASSKYREYIEVGAGSRFRTTCDVQAIAIYIGLMDNVTNIQVCVWRTNGANYDLVARTENLSSKITTTTSNYVVLTTPISVRVGDYYGYKIESTGANSQILKGLNQSGNNTYYTDTVVSNTACNWSTNSMLSGAMVPIHFYAQAPAGVTIGDSLIAGHPLNYAFIEYGNLTLYDPTSTIDYWLSDKTGAPIINMGIGSQKIETIAARFAADVVALKPRYAIIEGGVNNSILTERALFQSSWIAMLDLCRANSIKPIAMGVFPWTSGTSPNEKAIEIGIWNEWLHSTVLTYGGYYVDVRPRIGLYRAGGSPGNLWDIQTAYDSGDHIHLNVDGYHAAALAITDQVK